MQTLHGAVEKGIISLERHIVDAAVALMRAILNVDNPYPFNAGTALLNGVSPLTLFNGITPADMVGTTNMNDMAKMVSSLPQSSPACLEPGVRAGTVSFL